MKVIFLEDVPDVAMAGQVKEVKAGYARNYLLPRQLAALATPDQLQRQKKLLTAAEQRHHDQLEEAQQQAQKLEGLVLTIVARVGERGKLYGSVTGADITARVQEATGLQVDRHKVLLGQPLRELGSYSVPVRLAPEVRVTVQVNVVGEGPALAAGAFDSAQDKSGQAVKEDVAAAAEAVSGTSPSPEGEAPAAQSQGEKEGSAAQE